MQGAFDFIKDLPARPRRPERLFFALFPGSEASRRIGRMRDSIVAARRLTGPLVETERLHLSLHHVGDYVRLRDQVVRAARWAADTVSVRPFDVTFRCAHSFDAPPSRLGRTRTHPLVLLAEGDGLFELYACLGSALQKLGLKAGQHFTPHMTLLYGKQPVPTQAIEPVGFSVREFVLIHSERGLTRYNVIGRWPLSA